MPHVTAGDLDCFYQEDYFGTPWNDEPAAVLLQAGYAANSNHFSTWVPGLADRYRVLRRDAVGHGRTSPGEPGRDLSLGALADDVIAFLDELGLGTVHYVGERTGAMTGVVLAAKHPGRVRTLTIFGCPIACGTGLQHAMWEMLEPTEQARYTGWNDAIRGLGGTFAWHDHVHWLEDPADPRQNAWQREQLRLCDESLLERYAEATIEYDISSFLSSVSVPTLILAPTNTYRTNFGQQIQLRTSIPNAQLEIIEGSAGRADDGSGPHLARRIRAFIEQQSRSMPVSH
jgi:pimeloyl-ACP methyl ester carboxylesterase